MLGNRKAQHNFAKVPDVKMARSQFNRSFALKDTYDFDQLVPIFVDEILPGDTCNVQLSTFCRLATPKVPIMDNLYIDYFFFFVPNRLVWTNWERFNGAQDNPGDSTDYAIPTITTTAATGEIVGSIYDKFGIPTGVPGLAISALPLRAYNLIWRDWFRDENLQNSPVVNKTDGPDTPATYTLLKRGKRHDYMTSCLPSPQKGPAVSLPLGSTAPVQLVTNPPAWGVYNAGTMTGAGAEAWTINGGSFPQGTTSGLSKTLDPRGSLVANLSSATAATINQLRQAFSIQSMYELDNRGGTRYVEILQAHFNVVSPDFRLQRPEYLGGGQTKINSHPVAQTAPTSGSNPQGQLAAFATASTSGGVGFTKSFVEHGFVIGLACARADLTYQQGLERFWSKSTRFDFFWPKLQELGEQAVLNKEIYAVGSANPTQDATVFGYQERYAEYRFKPSQIHGQFRSTYSTPLDQWHMAELFGSLPALNSTFIQSNTPIARSIAVTSTGATILADYWFDYKHARPIMTYSVPSSLGKF